MTYKVNFLEATINSHDINSVIDCKQRATRTYYHYWNVKQQIGDENDIY